MSSSKSPVVTLLMLAAMAGGSYWLYKKVTDNPYSAANFYGQQWNRDHATYFRNVELAYNTSNHTDADFKAKLNAIYHH